MQRAEREHGRRAGRADDRDGRDAGLRARRRPASDNATVSGLVNPIAAQDEVVFRLYRGADCADANLILTRTDTSLTYNAGRRGRRRLGRAVRSAGCGHVSLAGVLQRRRQQRRGRGPCNAPNENVAGDAGGAGDRDGRVDDLCSVVSSGQRDGQRARQSAGGRDESSSACTGADDADAPARRSRSLNVRNRGRRRGTRRPFTPTVAGTYRWRAFYSGDANNAAVSGAVQRGQRERDGEPAGPPPPPPPHRRRRRRRRRHRRHRRLRPATGDRGPHPAADPRPVPQVLPSRRFRAARRGSIAPDRLRDDELQRSGHGPPDPAGGVLPGRQEDQDADAAEPGHALCAAGAARTACVAARIASSR